MEDRLFAAARPVWGRGMGNTMNETLCFTERFTFEGDAELKIAACNFYRIFLNGEFLGFGPARAAEGYSRVDVYRLGKMKGKNTLFVEVNAYGCNTLYAVNGRGFVQYELVSENGAVFATGENTRCRVFSPRTKKVLRFSFQRAFTEDYLFSVPVDKAYEGDFGGEELPCETLPCGKYLPRGVFPAGYEREEMRLVEGGAFFLKDDYVVCRSRYMLNEKIGIFPLGEIEFNTNDFLCSLAYEKGAAESRIAAGGYALYRSEGSHSGFLFLEFSAAKDSEIVLLFDEIDLRSGNGDGPAEICFYRNASQNHIRLRVRAGRQRFLSFEPYTAQYMKVLVREGEITIFSAGVVCYENEDCSGFNYITGEEKLDKIIAAAKETFRQNAVDLLTDCPSRERAGWLCDGFFSGRAEKFFTGKNLVEHNFLENYALAAQNPLLPEKMIDMCYPSSGCDNFIENWALFYILELEDYFRRTGDRALIALSEGKVRRLLEYFAAKENEFGLLEDSSGWVFVEWSMANDKKFTEGVNFPSNMLYAAAIDCADRLYGCVPEGKAEKLRWTIRELSFNGTFFEDNCVRENGKLVRAGHTSETCQYYAFYFGTADKTLYPALYGLLFDRFGPRRPEEFYPEVYPSNVFIGYYLRLDYLRREGRFEQALKESAEYFYKMAEETGTLWEHASPSASLCHGFASYIGKIIYDCRRGISE